MKHTDEELLDLYFEGDAKGFELFFARHSGRVVAYGQRMGLNHQDALDFTQEVFLKLHRMIHKYERGRPALPWFFTIVHYRLIDTLRQLKTSHSRFVSDDMKIENASAEVPSVETMQEISPEALEKLSQEQRHVMELRLKNDLSFKVIAEMIGKTEANARKIYERSVKTLKGNLLKQDHDDE